MTLIFLVFLQAFLLLSDGQIIECRFFCYTQVVTLTESIFYFLYMSCTMFCAICVDCSGNRSVLLQRRGDTSEGSDSVCLAASFLRQPSLKLQYNIIGTADKPALHQPWGLLVCIMCRKLQGGAGGVFHFSTQLDRS